MPCSAYLEGEYGIEGLFVGVPVKLGSDGVEEIIEVKLTGEEQKALSRSADSVRTLVDVLKGFEGKAVGKQTTVRLRPRLQPKVKHGLHEELEQGEALRK
jgi:hypothetical protein